MKKFILLLTILVFLNSAYAEENKTIDLTKMTDEELIAHFMETSKKNKALEKELKKSEEELSEAKKLSKTVDKLGDMLNIED